MIDPAIAASPEIQAQVDQFAVGYDFPLDDFQRLAIGTLIHGDSVMVAAPTGTGKTVVAEFGIYEAFRRNGRVFYTTPIKALSNQKFRDLRLVYGDEVGLLTGDVTENRDARIIVMTTEVLRNMLLQSPWDVDAVDCVIFDEIHYLADPERGTTWEESIILCPDHIQLICLSATVSNADEIADWIGRTHRPIRLITHTNRAVPLSLYYFHDRKLDQVVDHHGVLIRDFPNKGGEARKQVRRQGSHGRPRPGDRDDPGMDEPLPHEIIDALAAGDMLPAIYFLFSRNDCQVFAERLAAMRPHLVTPLQAQMIESVLQNYLKALRPEDRELDQVRIITALARKGIGFHHAGLLPLLKQVVEVLFSRGLMQVVFATDTLALGVNMPARSVVIGRMTKWDGRRRRILSPNEFQQMAGRAGRRGMDAYGHVVVPYTPWISFRETLEVATGPLDPVRSAFAVRYNTVLNLWDPPDGDRVRAMLRQSLAQYQASQRIRQLEDDIIEVSGDIVGVPQGCLIGLDGGDDLLEDYRRLTATEVAAEGKVKRVRQQMGDARAAAAAPPWTLPGRQVLRRAFRDAAPGLVAHHEREGWGIFLGRGKGGVGAFLFPSGMQPLNDFRQIDYLTDQSVRLPGGLVEPADLSVDPKSLSSAAEMKRVWKELEALDLPDLEGMRREHQERETERLAAEFVQFEADLLEAQQQLVALEAARDSHPCHACPRRKEHRAYLARIEELDGERAVLTSILERESEAEEARIRGVMRGIREVLSRFGYLYRGYPTGKADMLASVNDNDGLILCEVIDRHLIDDLPAEDVAEFFSWFSFDRDFRYANHFTLPDRLLVIRNRLEDIEHAILGEERDNGLFISEGHNATFYGAARAWARGDTMVEIGENLELSEGDLVLTFNKTIDLMRQMREMLTDVLPEHPLRLKLAEAERLLKRDIVEQSLVLGYQPVEPPPDDPALAAAAAAEAELFAAKPKRVRRPAEAGAAKPAKPKQEPAAKKGAAAKPGSAGTAKPASKPKTAGKKAKPER